MLRFAVHRPGNPVASPRSHRMSCGKVSGRVHVRIAGEGACSAPEDGLALARLPVHMPAGTASLTGECRVESLDPAGSLFIQAADQQPPPGGEDLSIQSGLLAHPLPGVACGPLCAPGHALDVQALDANQIEPARQVSAGLLTPVLTGIGSPGLEAGNGDSRLDSPSTATLRASQPAVQQAQTPLARPTQPGAAQQFTVGQSCAHGDAAVNAGNLTGARACDRLWDRSEGDMPPASMVQPDPERLDAFGDGTGPAESDPAAFWDKQLPDSAVQPPHVLRFDRDDAEPFVASGLAPRRPAMGTSKEVLHGLVKVSQGLLLHHLTTDGEPSVFPPRGGELPALLKVARCICPPWAPPRLLFASKIPHEPGMGAMLSQSCLIGSRREQAVPRHTKTLSSAADIPEEVKRRLVYCLNRQVTTPRTV
jgi:hypothetical protein